MIRVIKNVIVGQNLFVNTLKVINEPIKCSFSINSFKLQISSTNIGIEKKNSNINSQDEMIKNSNKSSDVNSLNEYADINRSDFVKQINKNFNFKKKFKKPRSFNPSQIPSFKVKAFATADWYDFNGLKESLIKSGAYDIFEIGKILPDNCICIKAKYEEINEIEPRHIFFFEDGSVVFWNVSIEEEKSVLEILHKHQEHSYSKEIVNDEVEIISFSRIASLFDNTRRSDDDASRQSQMSNFEHNVTDITNTGNSNNLNTKLYKNHIYFSNCVDIKTKKLNENKHILEKYAFSDAITLSVKLAIWERQLDNFSERIEYISNDLKGGNELKLESGQVLKLLGELFTMRHAVNLHSNFLDITPDFYWDRPKLEQLYHQMYSYLAISTRTRLFNDRLNHCIDLMQILEQHLKDNKHTRLEWIIIALIALEFLTGLGVFDFIKNYLKTLV